MPKAKKLPSGSWRCRVKVGDESRSFTVKDPSLAGKRRCEKEAAMWADRKKAESFTVGAKIKSYIDAKEDSLSPSTIASYRGLLTHAYTSIVNVSIDFLTDDIVQRWIDEHKTTHNPKTTRNAFGLLSAATGLRFDVRLPEKRPVDYYTPTDADIAKLLAAIKGTDLERAVLLAAFGTLREGEVCALTVQDFTKDSVTVSKSYAWNGKEYVLKEPKTAYSNRTVSIPEDIVSRIIEGRCDRIVDMSPRQLSDTFRRALARTDLPRFRFHDLRAYAASIRHALGIPDVYIMMDGGWKTDHILKTVYRRAMEDKRREFARRSGEHFSSILQST